MGKRKYLLLFLLIVTIASISVILGSMIKNEIVDSNPVSIDEKTASNQLLYSGVSVFSEKYTGYMSRTEITDRLEMMIKEEMPQMYSELGNKKDEIISNYFKKNMARLEEDYGFEDERDLISMIKFLKDSEINLSSYEKLSVDMDSFKDMSEKTNYSYVEYKVSYSNGDVINFSMYISKKQSIRPTFIIRIIK